MKIELILIILNTPGLVSKWESWDLNDFNNIPNVDELVDRYKQLSNRDSEKKSQIIVQFVMAASQAGVDANLISQGISEIINGKETPTVDQIISQIEQQARQAEQAELQRQQQLAAKQTNLAQQQMMEQYRQQMSAQQSQPQLTGDEVLGEQEQPQLTVDEVLGQ